MLLPQKKRFYPSYLISASIPLGKLANIKQGLYWKYSRIIAIRQMILGITEAQSVH